MRFSDDILLHVHVSTYNNNLELFNGCFISRIFFIPLVLRCSCHKILREVKIVSNRHSYLSAEKGVYIVTSLLTNYVCLLVVDNHVHSFLCRQSVFDYWQPQSCDVKTITYTFPVFASVWLSFFFRNTPQYILISYGKSILLINIHYFMIQGKFWLSKNKFCY